jgi:uncharacterized membrane protein
MTTERRSGPETKLARFLGWFSLALGVPQIVAPGAVNRLAGIRDDDESRRWQRIVGVREIAAFVGILSNRRPVGWLWARVAGDVKDLGLLGAAHGNKRERGTRLTAVTAGIVAVTGLDLFTAVRMTRNPEATTTEDLAMEVKAAITVRRPVGEVFAFWNELENLPQFMDHLESVRREGDGRSRWRVKAPGGGDVEWVAEVVAFSPDEIIEWRSVEGSSIENSGLVRFAVAPGGRGTEVHVQMAYAMPAGKLGAAFAKLFGEEPSQQVRDDLRRFKQLMETGEIVRSPGSPEGLSTRRMLRQRPAQPLPVGAGTDGSDS